MEKERITRWRSSSLDRSPNEGVERVRQVVEAVLELQDLSYRSFATGEVRQKRFSTDLQKADPGLSCEVLRGLCVRITTQLNAVLTGHHFRFRYYQSPRHSFLIADFEDGENVVVDPTIGQFVVGHNHVFVGTYAELRDLITHQTGETGPYALSPEVLCRGRHKFMKDTWGPKAVLL